VARNVFFLTAGLLFIFIIFINFSYGKKDL
jgi:hypothetical protein